MGDIFIDNTWCICMSYIPSNCIPPVIYCVTSHWYVFYLDSICTPWLKFAVNIIISPCVCSNHCSKGILSKDVTTYVVSSKSQRKKVVKICITRFSLYSAKNIGSKPNQMEICMHGAKVRYPCIHIKYVLSLNENKTWLLYITI